MTKHLIQPVNKGTFVCKFLHAHFFNSYTPLYNSLQNKVNWFVRITERKSDKLKERLLLNQTDF